MHRLPIVFLLLLLSAAPVLAQTADCLAVVEQALAAVAEKCSAVARNSACFAHQSASVVPQVGADVRFEAQGDMVDLLDIFQLNTFYLNTPLQRWGVGVISAQTTLPDTREGVRFIVFGDVTLKLSSDAPLLRVTTGNLMNVRAEPHGSADVLTQVSAGDVLYADARLADGTWLRVQAGDGRVGWVATSVADVQGDVTTLPTTPARPMFPQAGGDPARMQSFRFSSGSGVPPCDVVPSGILVQVPLSAGEVVMRINGVEVRATQTLFLQAVDGDFRVMVLEGRALLRTATGTVYAPGGTLVSTALGTDGLASAAPGVAQTYDPDLVARIPLTMIEGAGGVPIKPAAPLIPELLDLLKTVPTPGVYRQAATRRQQALTCDNRTITVSGDERLLLIRTLGVDFNALRVEVLGLEHFTAARTGDGVYTARVPFPLGDPAERERVETYTFLAPDVLRLNTQYYAITAACATPLESRELLLLTLSAETLGQR